MIIMTEGIIQEEKVIEKVKELIDRKELIDSSIKFIKSKSEQENSFDFKLIFNFKEYLFEIYSPEQDFNVFHDKFKNTDAATFGNKFLKFAIINKYYKQFKNNSDKFLIININNDGNFGLFNLNYSKNKISRISKIFSCPVFPDGFIGLFHRKEIKIANQLPPDEISLIEINYLKNMKGVITFYKGNFVEFIVNPFSNLNDSDETVIKKLFKINILTKNNHILSEYEDSIEILNQNNGYQKIYDNILYKIINNKSKN